MSAGQSRQSKRDDRHDVPLCKRPPINLVRDDDSVSLHDQNRRGYEMEAALTSTGIRVMNLRAEERGTE